MFKQRKSESGFAPVMMLVIVVVLVAVGGAGYYVYNKNKDKNSSSSTTPAQAASNKAVNDACNTALKDKDFCKFASNWEGLTNYKTTITSNGAEGTSTMVLETENSDKTRMTTSTGGKETAAYVTIGNDSYIKDEADGSWTKFTNDSATSNTPDIKGDIKVSDFSAAELAKTQYKKIGKEACGKLTCLKYQIVENDTPTTETFIWFDTKDFLLRRITTKEGADTSEMTMSYDKVSISTPSPVKSSSSSSDNSIPSQAEIDAAMQAAQDAQQ